MKKRAHNYSRWDLGEAHTIEITDYVLAILLKLFVHGPLSNAMLHALTAPAVNARNTRLRTKLMKRKPNLLVEQPKQQRLVHNANYQSLSFRITKAGVQVLHDRGRITREQAELHFKLRQNYRTYHHDALTAYITASIELGCRDAGFGYHGWEYILTHRRCPEATRLAVNPLAITYYADGKKRALIPDAIFAIRTGEGTNCFVLETDRHNEPIDSHELNRSSYGMKLSGYLAVFKEEHYERHFGVPNLQVLNATVSDIHMRNIMKRLQEMTTRTRPFLFKSLSEMSRYENTPVISGHLLQTPWHRVGYPEKLLHQSS